MSFYQIFLPIASVVYFLLVFVLRSYIQWKKTGINPFVFKKSERAHDYIGRVYKAMILCIWISISVYSFSEEVYAYLIPIGYLENPTFQFTGLVLLITSFIVTTIAQYQMSASWRIGIDYNERTELVSDGLFLISRNPVFLGVLITYLGTFLIIPNALSFSILLITYVSIQIQVRLEEEYLLNVHGPAYEEYKKVARRWL